MLIIDRGHAGDIAPDALPQRDRSCGVFCRGGDMRSAAGIMIALASLLVAACDSARKESPPDLLKSRREAMDKAGQTEAVIDQAAAERLKRAGKIGRAHV